LKLLAEPTGFDLGLSGQSRSVVFPLFAGIVVLLSPHFLLGGELR